MDGFNVDGWTDVWMDGLMMDGLMERRIGLMDGWMDDGGVCTVVVNPPVVNLCVYIFGKCSRRVSMVSLIYVYMNNVIRFMTVIPHRI